MTEWIYTQKPADADLALLHPKFDPTRGRNFFLPDRILDELRSPGFQLQGRHGQTVLGHSLQSATMAERDGWDDEYVICCLVHDVMHNFAPGLAHADLAGALVQPYVSEANWWLVKHHNIFVGYYAWGQMGRDANAREQFRDSPYFDYTDEFVVKYDEPARDVDYRNEPLEHFESRLRDMFGKPPKVEKDPYALDPEMLKANGYAT